MAADDTGEVLRPWEKSDFFVEGNDFFVRLTRLIAVPLNLLRPSNHQAEIGCLSQFSYLSCFRSRQDLGPQTCGLEMLSGAFAAGGIDSPHEFRVAAKFL